MTDLFQEPDDATPLALEQRNGLLQTWISNRADLNEAEEENIVKGAAWARRRRSGRAVDLRTDEYVKTLHKQMFGEVWKNGQVRTDRTKSTSGSSRSGFPRKRIHDAVPDACLPPTNEAIITSAGTIGFRQIAPGST
jgi:fido (protein-threonine AMPylation protein)